MRLAKMGFALVLASGMTVYASDFLTEGVDNARTGWVRDEKVFTTANVGNTKLPSGQWVGDVDFAAVSERAHVTPVPGGVGPMTRAMLLRNTLRAAQNLLGGGL